MTDSRIYLVSSTHGTKHLVSAGSATQALRHVVAKTHDVHLATQRELVDLAKIVEVEEATAAAEPDSTKPSTRVKS